MADKKDIAKLSFDVSDAKKGLDELQTKLNELSKSSENLVKNFNQGMKGNAINFDTSKATKNLQDLEKLTEKLGKTVTNTYLKGVNQAEKAEQQKDVAAYKTMLKQETYNEKVAESTKSLYERIGNYAQTYLAYQGFNALKKGIQETIDEMVQVEQQIIQIDRVMSIAGMNTDAFRDKLIQLAYDYGNSFNNVADVSLRIAQAGVKGEANLQLTEKTLLALNTAELDATQATDDMIAVMSQWGLLTGTASEQATQYGNIIDKVNKVADNFPTTSADILDALKKTSSAFKLAGADINETIATIVAAEKASQRGGKVIGTALANITQQLKAEGKLNLAEQLGLNFYTDETKTQFKNVIDIFKEMSERMQKLKDEGKESSVEMQQLLEMFTVFRRNVGASLLGEMEGGEASTYMQVYKTALDSVGYSLSENEKYMKSAKAAQEQFNAELLKLKTTVWDAGLEDFFRDFLSFGKDVVENIGTLIKQFGAMPVAITAVVSVFSLLNKNLRASEWLKMADSVKKVNKAISESKDGMISYGDSLKGTSDSFKKYVKSVGDGEVSLKGYRQYLAKTTIETVTLTLKTIALQAAISAGVTVITGLITTGISKLINARKDEVEMLEKSIDASKEKAEKLGEERTNLQELTKQYEELAKKEERSPEDEQKIYELQSQINSLLKENGEQVELITQYTDEQGKVVTKINDKYDEQLDKLKAIAAEKQKQQLEEAANTLKLAKENKMNSQDILEGGAFQGFQEFKLFEDLQKSGVKFFGRDTIKVWQDFNSLDIQGQVKVLEQWNAALSEQNSKNRDVTDSLKLISSALDAAKGKLEKTTSAQEAYNTVLDDYYRNNKYFAAYSNTINKMLSSFTNEGPKALATKIKELNSSFSDGRISIAEYGSALRSEIDKIDSSKFKQLQEGIKEIEDTKLEEKFEQISWKATEAQDAIKDANKGLFESQEDINESIQNTTNLTEEEIEELREYEAVITETTKFLVEGLSDVVTSYENGQITFADYTESLAESNKNMLELYATTKDLHYEVIDGTAHWVDAEGAIDSYAEGMLRAQDNALSMVDTLRLLGDNYQYIAENADEFGNANFKATAMATEAYQQLAVNFANSLENMKQTNQASYNAIVSKALESSSDIATEFARGNAYLTDVFLNDNDAFNLALNEMARQSQEATNKLATSTGELVNKLADVIENFDYNIDFGIEGSINAGGNILDLLTGQDFHPTSSLRLTIKGSSGEGGSISEFASALKTWATDFGNYISTNSGYKSLLDTIKPPKYTPTTPSGGSGEDYSGGPGGGGSGGSGGGSGGSGSTRTDNTAEKEYQNKLKAYKAFVTDREKLEQSWVKKQQQLDVLTANDYMYITHQRLIRYQAYLDNVKKATWMNAEDRLAIEQQYTEKIEELRADYMKYLKDKYEEDVKNLQEANKKKIQAIKDKAQAEIDALKKVDSENTRIRKKEDYEKQRGEILNEIEYWSQGVSWEAQKNLAAAKKKLAELDEDWKRVEEDWAIDDKIKKIEEKRDKQIEAIETAEANQIAAWKKVYDERVKAYSESDKIIFDESKIHSKALYNTYKKNFIDPLNKDLKNMNKVNGTAPAKSNSSSSNKNTNSQPYETYTVKYGDSLSSIAQGFYGDASMWPAIYEDNKDVIGSNPDLIFEGQVYKIPKFHEGGIVGGNKEGYALLKPQEVVLKPEWAEGLNKMVRMINSNDKFSLSQGNNTTIEVKGDMVKISANISNKNDADYLTRKIEKTLKEKFNIKK